jgi:hypothetical protein
VAAPAMDQVGRYLSSGQLLIEVCSRYRRSAERLRQMHPFRYWPDPRIPVMTQLLMDLVKFHSIAIEIEYPGSTEDQVVPSSPVFLRTRHDCVCNE